MLRASSNVMQDLHALMVPCPSVDEPRLLLAGEHTHPLYWSFMHGARLSGHHKENKTFIAENR